jgi:hypothetical protein
VTCPLWSYKPHNTDKFIPLSQALGVEEDNGVQIVDQAKVEIGRAAANAGDHSAGARGAPGFPISVNDLDQRSVGAHLIKDAAAVSRYAPRMGPYQPKPHFAQIARQGL